MRDVFAYRLRVLEVVTANAAMPLVAGEDVRTPLGAFRVVFGIGHFQNPAVSAPDNRQDSAPPSSAQATSVGRNYHEACRLRSGTRGYPACRRRKETREEEACRSHKTLNANCAIRAHSVAGLESLRDSVVSGVHCEIPSKVGFDRRRTNSWRGSCRSGLVIIAARNERSARGRSDHTPTPPAES